MLRIKSGTKYYLLYFFYFIRCFTIFFKSCSHKGQSECHYVGCVIYSSVMLLMGIMFITRPTLMKIIHCSMCIIAIKNCSELSTHLFDLFAIYTSRLLQLFSSLFNIICTRNDFTSYRYKV